MSQDYLDKLIEKDETGTQIQSIPLHDTELRGITIDDPITVEGNPINFSTKNEQNAIQTVVDLEPIQDLHGYSKPWVGGAGKNLLPLTIEGIKSANSGATWIGNSTVLANVTVTIVTDNDNNVIGIKFNGTANSNILLFTQSVYINGNYTISGCPSGGSNGTYRLDVRNASNSSVIIEEYGTAKQFTYEGNVIGLIRIANGTNVNNLIYIPQLEVGDTKTTFAPYTNICPILPHEEIKIGGCGKNLIDTNSATQGKDINSSGEIVNASDTHYVTDYIPVIETKTLHQNRIGNWAAIGNAFYDKNKNFLSFISGEYLISHNLNFTVPENAKYVRCTITDPINTMQLEYGTSETSYTAYKQSNSLTLPLPEDIYGGTLNLETGEMRVEKKIADFGNFTWYYDSSRSVMSSNQITDTAIGSGVNANFINTAFERNDVAIASMPNNTSKITNGYFYVKTNLWTDDSVFKTTMTGQKLVYELADSYKYTIQLTPHQLKLFKDVNNLNSSDYTTLNVTYHSNSIASLAPATDTTDGLLTAMDKRALDRTEEIIEGNPIAFETESTQVAKSTIVDIEPIQDLHGYSKPWVGGAGKNLLPMTVDDIKNISTNTGTWDNNVYTKNDITFTFIQDSDNNVTGIKINGTPTSDTFLYFPSINANGSYKLNGCPSGGEYVKYNISTKVDGAWTTTSYDYGSGANITATSSIEIAITIKVAVTNQMWYPMIRLSTVTDSTFEPYTNIASISGRSAITVDVCGKNLVDVNNIKRIHPKTGDINDKWITFDQYIPYVPDVSYVFTSIIGISTVYAMSLNVYDSDFNYIVEEAKININPNNISFSIANKEGSYVKIGFYHSSSLSGYTMTNPLLCPTSNTDGVYTPYQQSTSLQIQLDETVYGGQLDVENGVLVVDREMKVYDGTNYTPTDHYTGNIYVNIENTAKYKPSNEDLWMSCNCAKWVANDITTRGSYCYNGSLGAYFTKNSTFASASDFAAYALNNNIQMVIPILTPTTISLTPEQVKLLSGVNTITTNADKITLTYRNGSVATLNDLESLYAKLKAYIDSLHSS